jgi:alanine-glyoxylate transaminase / serine-glyoxylate transaminase / serine-pyruvate transaminase
MVETGQFAALWKNIAVKLGLKPELIETDWRRGAPPELIEERLRADKAHAIKAVCVVHNETSTGCMSRIPEIRAAMNRAGHPALLMVDSVSGLGSVDLQHDAWGIDVTIAGSQKGLMLPPGLSFNAVSDKAMAAHKTSTLARTYWDWSDMLPNNERGYFPYTPATNLLYGLDTAIDMLLEEGLDNVFARHFRHAAATRAAVHGWGLETLCAVESEHSPVVTTVLMPSGQGADALRQVILERFDLSLGMGLGKVNGKVFRIGHLGDINDLTLLGAIAGVEMGLGLAGVPHNAGGVQAAMRVLAA